MVKAAPNEQIHAALCWLAIDRMEPEYAGPAMDDFHALEPDDWADRLTAGPTRTGIAGGILDRATREQLIDWLDWNDNGNGCYRDEDSAAEGMEPITKAEAIESALNQIAGL